MKEIVVQGFTLTDSGTDGSVAQCLGVDHEVVIEKLDELLGGTSTYRSDAFVKVCQNFEGAELVYALFVTGKSGG